MHEQPPVVAQEQAPASIIQRDGSLNLEYLATRFGIGEDEAMQRVSFGDHKGTVAEMLDDRGCPVGGIVASAYKKEGLDGVIKKFKALGSMDVNFSVVISESTILRELKKKKVQ